ncbi:MAG TPA: DNA cytosine methyltransferase [Candidatus Methylacidiphilales bacterium]|nr:DNA cytosine methyltransferase [Candidatus Methylacidiphilales bacterium]
MISLRKTNKRPIGIDLFAGAGGLSLSFEQAGFDVAAAVEIDPIHCATHEFNFPNTTTICASVADMTGKLIRDRAGLQGEDIDVVFGGPPCQGFSMIGKRTLDDPRNSLVFHYVRLIRGLKPKYCVFENVKGLTLGLHSKFLSELIGELRAAKYKVLLPYRVLNAADFGVPQDRRRLFLIAARTDMELPSYPKAKEMLTTVWDAIGDLPDADKFDVLNHTDAVSVRWTSHSLYAKQLRNIQVDPEDFGYPRNFDRNLLSSSLRTRHTDLSKERFLNTFAGDTEPVSRFHKLDPESVCNTLRAGTDSARGAFTSPRPIHPHYPRVITVREAARLHSYPDWFRFHSTKWHGFRQVGNSVPPLLGRAVAAEIVKALGVRPKKPTIVCDFGNTELLQFDMQAAARYFGVRSDVIPQRLRKPLRKRTALPEESLQLFP